jgi:hypothetical protein
MIEISPRNQAFDIFMVPLALIAALILGIAVILWWYFLCAGLVLDVMRAQATRLFTRRTAQ